MRKFVAFAIFLFFNNAAFSQNLQGIYRRVVVTSVTTNQFVAANTSVLFFNLGPVRGITLMHNPSTAVVNIIIAIDQEELIGGATVADIRARIGNWCLTYFGKLPDSDQPLTAGAVGLTPRDRCRQFIAVREANTDPITIGIAGPTLAARRSVLSKQTTACLTRWGL